MFLLKIKYGNILSTCQKINNRFSNDRVLCDPNKGRLRKNKESWKYLAEMTTQRKIFFL